MVVYLLTSHHQGDELAHVFAEALAVLPHVQHLNLRDNRLTDDGIDAVLSAVIRRR
jgi:hypothetical protein